MLDLTNFYDSDRLLLGRRTTPSFITPGQQPIDTNGFLPKLGDKLIGESPIGLPFIHKPSKVAAFVLRWGEATWGFVPMKFLPYLLMKHCPSCHSTHINSNGCFDCGMRFSEIHKDFGNGYIVYEAGYYYSILTPSSCAVLPRDIFWGIVTEYCDRVLKGKA